MRQAIVVSVLCLFCSTGATGRTNDSSDVQTSGRLSPDATIGVFVEFGGYSPMVLSANADIQWTILDGSSFSQLGFRVGYAISFYNYRTIPILINGSIGTSHRFEYGAGVVVNPYGVPLVETGGPAFNLSQTTLKIGAHSGWRFQESGGGWLIRGTITGLYDTGIKRFYPMFGISVGFQFQY